MVLARMAKATSALRNRSMAVRVSGNVLLVLQEQLARQVDAESAVLGQPVHPVGDCSELNAVAGEDHADDLLFRAAPRVLAEHDVPEERCLLPVDLRGLAPIAA